MTDETLDPQVDETQDPVVADNCDRCACDDCPGIHPDTTAELAQHSKACPEKHF